MDYILSEPDIRIFLREAPRAARLSHTVKYAAGVISAGIFALGLISALAPRQTVRQEPVVSSAALVPAAQAATPTPVATPVPTPTPLPITLPNDTISLGDLGVSAPIIWNVNPTQKDMNTALVGGVIHLAGTPVPGQQGMVAIAGHSSNYPWIKGDFNQIFAPLPKAVLGQTIELNYSNVMYRYTIKKIYEVSPNQVDVLNDNSRTGLRLITCTPVGTSLRRLIIEADQVFPDYKTATPFDGSVVGTLPSDR